MSPKPNAKVVLIPVATNMPAPSSLTTGWIYSILDLQDVEDWGPFLEEITAHTNTQGATTYHEWKIVFFTSYDGKEWSSPIDLFTAIAAGSGAAVQTPYTTTSNFARKIRFALASRSSSAGAVQSAVVSCSLAFVFRS